MNFKLKNVILPLIIVTAGFSSCYPVDDLLVEDLDVAATLYDKAYYSPETGENNFEELRTFTVVDTIVHIIGEYDEDNISRSYDDFVLEQVRLNMLKMGFVEETDPDANAADVAITVSAISSEHEVYYWYPYWGWYWGYYPYASSKTGSVHVSSAAADDAADPYSYYYPWYPYGSYYTYQSGTLLMEMVDVARIDPDVEEIPVIWAGIANGVMAESQSGTQARLSKGIDQCFAQSPYLLKTLNNPE
jgi:hypothetical protein